MIKSALWVPLESYLDTESYFFSTFILNKYAATSTKYHKKENILSLKDSTLDQAPPWPSFGLWTSGWWYRSL